MKKCKEKKKKRKKKKKKRKKKKKKKKEKKERIMLMLRPFRDRTPPPSHPPTCGIRTWPHDFRLVAGSARRHLATQQARTRESDPAAYRLLPGPSTPPRRLSACESRPRGGARSFLGCGTLATSPKLRTCNRPATHRARQALSARRAAAGRSRVVASGRAPVRTPDRLLRFQNLAAAIHSRDEIHVMRPTQLPRGFVLDVSRRHEREMRASHIAARASFFFLGTAIVAFSTTPSSHDPV